MIRLVCALLLAGAVAGCEQAPRKAAVAAAPAARPAARPAAPPAAPPFAPPASRPASQPAASLPGPGPRFGGEPAAASLTSACRALVEEYKQVAVAATSTCATAADCACYASPWLELAGRVADKATAARLGEIRSNYQREGCPRVDTPHLKAPAPCVARCVAGRCVAGG